jgi:hypothetical protein
MGHVQRAALQRLQAVVTSRHKAAAHRRRSAKQVEQHKGMAAEVADQRKVLLVVQPGQRPVVVDARDGLHTAAIAVAQAHAVHALGAAHVGRAVHAQRNRLVGGQPAGHRAHPQLLVANGAVHRLVNLRELGQAGIHPGVHASDQLELRFAVIGGDGGVRQRRPQRRRVGRERQATTGLCPQAFFLDAAADAGKACQRQGTQALVQCSHWASP